MDIKIGIRDRRNPGWYRIDNEVYDLPMSCEALSVYNAIARFANNDTENAYFSGKKWKKHHGVGHSKLANAMRELISHKLIRATGDKTNVGAAYYELCNIDHLKKTLFQGETGGCAEVKQGGVPRQNTNYTNKVIQENIDSPLSILPKLKEPKKAKNVQRETVIYPEIDTLITILKQNNMKESTISYNLKRLMKNAVDLHGIEFCERALNGRIIEANRQNKPWYLSTFFDPEQGEWFNRCAIGSIICKEYKPSMDEEGLKELDDMLRAV